MKRIFLTGAAGFIGFHLGRFLAQRGDQVLGYDNFNAYYSPKLKEDRARILEQEGVPVVRGDLCDLQFLSKTIQEFQPTHVVHLAAQAGVRHSIEQPHSYLKSNVEGFLNILENCRQLEGVPLIYASSSSVYGSGSASPFSVEDSCDQPVSFYGATKRSNELFAYSYHHLYGIPVTGLRFFTVYGPWGRPDMAYYLFTESIDQGKPIPVFNQGKMERDFTYIDDVVEGTAAAIDRGFSCELFNLGHHQPVKLEEVIGWIERSLGKKSIKEYLPMQPGDVEATFADISKSQEKLGFHPKTTMEEGISRFVEWYRKYHQSLRV